MFRRAMLALALLMAFGVALEAVAQNRAYYGTQRHMSARQYSGEYQAMRPNVVPTFSLPVYGGGGYRSYYRGGGYGGYYGGYPVYRQPVIIYPPAIYYGF
ncbi:hypothetical protein [Botrimarina mediterranea]|uniref:Uncharacterized protein n=1 Tax=Botrimarina mediterranea TaxID=2528022 RepID=A0A518K2D6_9BACT|nr:hypothetical protein [Botrimarina mediterranea]QDV71971.1 hypothetical protein Spa11_01400 [Botrimarina mediterranea]QDV76512.1 hypothetical protein K2D_00900 [Planctomycetes bacterium K2D]